MMDNFTHILRRMPTAADAPSTSSHSRGATPFKVQVNFDIPLFEGKIDANALEKWLILLEGYFFVQKNFDNKKITFVLLRSLHHVKYWWDGYCERHAKDESDILKIEPTWESFVDVVKHEFCPVENYDDQHTWWMTLHQERDQTMLEYTNIFPTLRSKLGIRYCE